MSWKSIKILPSKLKPCFEENHPTINTIIKKTLDKYKGDQRYKSEAGWTYMLLHPKKSDPVQQLKQFVNKSKPAPTLISLSHITME